MFWEFGHKVSRELLISNRYFSLDRSGEPANVRSHIVSTLSFFCTLYKLREEDDTETPTELVCVIRTLPRDTSVLQRRQLEHRSL